MILLASSWYPLVKEEGVVADVNGTVALERDPLLLTLVTLAAFLVGWLPCECPGDSMIKSLFFSDDSVLLLLLLGR